jgi:hypothetical protein
MYHPHEGAIQAEMPVPAPLLSAVLGEGFVDAIRAAEAASSAEATATAASPGVDSVMLRVSALPPHWYGPAMSDLDWGASGWEELLHAPLTDGILSSPLPPEMSWMEWDPPADLDWNAGQVAPGAASLPTMLTIPFTASSSSTAALLTKACKAQLPAADKLQLLAELRSGEPSPSDGTAPPGFAPQISLEIPPALAAALEIIPPSRLPQLVEKNHEIAIEFLRQLMLCSQARAMSGVSLPAGTVAALPSVNSYLTPLVCMDMSLHSMEVCKALSVVEPPQPTLLLPPDFLHLFLTRAMAACAKAQDKWRHVRLLCAFITTLIRKKLIHVQPYPTATVIADGASATNATGGATSSTSASSVVPSLPSSGNAAAAGSASASTSGAAASPAAAVSSSPPPSYVTPLRDVLLVEVSAFLVEYASQKEAVTLYKLIKSIEAGNAGKS